MCAIKSFCSYSWDYNSDESAAHFNSNEWVCACDTRVGRVRCNTFSAKYCRDSHSDTEGAAYEEKLYVNRKGQHFLIAWGQAGSVHAKTAKDGSRAHGKWVYLLPAEAAELYRQGKRLEAIAAATDKKCLI